MATQVQSTASSMENVNEPGSILPESRPKSLPGFNRLIQQICDQLVEKRLLNSKEAFRFMRIPDNLKIRKLLLIFADRGPEIFNEFLSVLRNIDNYPTLSIEVRRVVDNFETFLGTHAANTNSSSKNKRSSDYGQKDKYCSAKRSKSEQDIHLDENSHDVRLDVSQNTDQKALYRKSCPDDICWEHHVPSHEQHRNNETLLKENVIHEVVELKEDHVVIDIPPEDEDVSPKPRRSESKESLLGLDVSRDLKIKKKKNKSFFKTWKGLGVIALGAFGAGAYLRSRPAELSAGPLLSDITQNTNHLDYSGLRYVKDETMKPYEKRVKNSTLFEYNFYK